MANLYVSYNTLVMGPSDDPNGYCNGPVGCTRCCTIPTPYVSQTHTMEYIGSKAYAVTELSISGTIYADDSHVAANTEYNAIDLQRNSILSAFNGDYNTLTIQDGSTILHSFKYCVVKDISFDSGSVGVLGFSISLVSHTAYFRDWGILDPKNEYNYSEGEDGVLTLRHSISARVSRANSDWNATTGGDYDGDIDENDPIALARTWCTSMMCANTGCTNYFPLTYQSNWSNFGGDPFSVSHTYNRATGTYSIEEVWKQGKYSTSGYVETYDINEKYSTSDEYSTIQINYSIKGPPNTALATLRSQVPNNTEFYNKINSLPHGLVSSDSLNYGVIDPNPISYEVKENLNEVSLNVSVAYNLLNPAATGSGATASYTFRDWSYTAYSYYYHSATNGYAFLDWDISISTDHTTQVTTVDVNATMKSKGSNDVRKQRTSAWISSLGASVTDFLAAFASREYYQTYGGSYVFSGADHYPLSPFAQSESVEKNAKTGEINLKATFTNVDTFPQLVTELAPALPAGPAGVITGNYWEWKDFTFDINQKCAIKVMSIKGGQNSGTYYPDYLIFDHYTMTKETTTVSARGVEGEGGAGGYWSYGSGGTSVPDIALAFHINTIQNNFIQAPLSNNYDLRGLETNDITKSRLGAWSSSELANFISKTVTLSQTVSAPFIDQDGRGVLGLGAR